MLEFFETTSGHLVLNLIESILIFLCGAIAVQILNGVVSRLLNKTKLSKMLHEFIIHAVEIFIWVVTILSILNKLGIDSTSIVTVIAACGAAVALALQNSLSNLASGLLIIASKNFDNGDYIICNGIEGTVEGIDLLNTKLVTGDNRIVIVPNSQLTSNSMTNVTTQGTRRIEIMIDVSYDSDLDLARKTLVDLALADERVLKTPAPMCNVWEFRDSGITLSFRLWTVAKEYWNVKFDLQNQMLGALTKADISVPFPQMDVHLDK